MATSVSTMKWLCAAVLLFLGSERGFAEEASPAADPVAGVAPFVNDDTFFVGYLDLASASEAKNLLNLLPQQSPAETLTLKALGNAIEGLQSAGADGMYVVLGLGDVYENGGPLLVVHLKPGADRAAAENMLRGFSQSVSAVSRNMPQFPVERRGTETLVFGSELTVARYKSLSVGKRDDLVESLTTLTDDGAAVVAVFSPGPDFRRVVRELWPAMPAPLKELRGELADRWLRLEFAVKPSPQAAPSAQLMMQATDAASAELFAQLLRALPNASEQLTEIGNKRHDLQRYLQTIVEAVPPEVDGTRVVMRLPTDKSQLAKLQSLLSEAAEVTLESTRRQQRMQQFKQMALAMHNYYDVNKHFPPPSIRDQDGRPLLSWRVAILPYLEEGDHRDQFHLDEPWDSPHNLQLAKQMPEQFADPALPDLAREGTTTYVVPVGPGTVFDTKDGITFREIIDGTSKTIMIVEVPPERAVIWTRPEDWEVDMERPLRGIERTDRDKIVTVFCDGAAHVMPMDIKPDVLRAFLTRSGKETVDWP